MSIYFNPLQPNVAFLYPLKTSGYRKATPGCNGLNRCNYNHKLKGSLENLSETSWTSSESLMYVQFTSCVQGEILFRNHIKCILNQVTSPQVPKKPNDQNLRRRRREVLCKKGVLKKPVPESLCY